jgi:hypothetical protein
MNLARRSAQFVGASAPLRGRAHATPAQGAPRHRPGVLDPTTWTPKKGRDGTGPGPTCPPRAAAWCRSPSAAERRGLHRVPPLTPRRAFRWAPSASGRSGGPRRRCWCTRARAAPAAAAARRAALRRRRGRARAEAAASSTACGLPPRRPAEAGGLEEGRQDGQGRPGEPRHAAGAAHELWLDLRRPALPTDERKLSRLCAWVLQADKLGWTTAAPARPGDQAGLEARRTRGAAWRRWPVLPAAPCMHPMLASLPAARRPRHPVPAGGHRLGVLPQVNEPALVVQRAGRRWCCCGAAGWPCRPSRCRAWWLLALLAAHLAATWLTHRTLLGRDAGVTLIVVLLALKTLELRARRDAFVVFFLGFFCMLSNFFFSQSLLSPSACCWGCWAC